jgi:cytoskeletal protein CcmA (bactofilin family)
MPIFERNTPSKVMGQSEAPKQKASSAPPSPKEKLMEKQSGNKSTLLESMPQRRPAPERPAAAAAAGAPGRPGGETFISGDTIVEGKIRAQGELVVDGSFKGDLVSTSRVEIGTAGKVEGTIEAKSMVIRGQVVGDLRIHERLELLSTGELLGDLDTQPGALIIEQGARIEGRCTMGIAQERKDAPPAAAKSQPKPGGAAPTK